jgi:iron complex outermembrane receptor protein
VRNSEWTSNLDLSKKVDVGLASPLFIAAGAEYRENSYATDAGEPASYANGGYRAPVGQLFAGALRVSGSQGVTGFAPENAGEWKRHSWSGYVNIEQTIVRGIDVALAGRHEDYSDFGTADIGKASLRIEPVKGIALRGTVSSGFRAPTLQQQHYSSSSTILTPVNGVTTLVPVRALPVDSAAAIALGANPLKAEKSLNYSAGVVLTPLPRLAITVDAYQIKVEDRILLSGTLQGAAVNAVLAAAGITSSTAGFYFSNAADTRTRGLDVVATYRADLGNLGSGTLSLLGNLNKTVFTHIDLPPTALANAGLVLIDRVRQGDLTRGSPRNKVIANLFWEKDALSMNLRATRYGETYLTSTIEANDDRISPNVISDVEFGAKLTQGVKVSVGANNLFNVYPDKLKAVNQGTAGFAYYNPFSPYGISGGYYYGKISLNF